MRADAPAHTLAAMRSPAPAIAALACLGALIAASPASAKKKAPSSATYKVTFKAAMDEKWQYLADYADDCELTGAMCTRVEKGTGSARIQLKTRGPQIIMVSRGAKGQPPVLNTGSDGLAVTGSYLRTGVMTTEYGGPWDGANPDRAEPTTGCGNRSMSTSLSFGWAARNRLQPAMSFDELREDCPDGPGDAVEWEGGKSPSLWDMIARLDQKKFLNTKQFTARLTRTWKGRVKPFGRSDASGHYTISGDQTVTWHWEATFRMKTKKKRR
jgi:hypothetical protein